LPEWKPKKTSGTVVTKGKKRGAVRRQKESSSISIWSKHQGNRLYGLWKGGKGMGKGSLAFGQDRTQNGKTELKAGKMVKRRGDERANSGGGGDRGKLSKGTVTNAARRKSGN